MHHAYCNLCGAKFMNHPEGLTRNTWQTCSLFLEIYGIGLPHDLWIWNLIETTDITEDLLHRFVWKYPRIHWFITISPIEIKWYKFWFAGSTQCSDRPSWENVHVWYISGDIIGLMYPNQRDLFLDSHVCFIISACGHWATLLPSCMATLEDIELPQATISPERYMDLSEPVWN